MEDSMPAALFMNGRWTRNEAHPFWDVNPRPPSLAPARAPVDSPAIVNPPAPAPAIDAFVESFATMDEALILTKVIKANFIGCWPYVKRSAIWVRFF